MAVSLRRQILTSLWPYRGLFLLSLAQVVLIGGAELLKPWPLKIIIDNVVGGKPLAWSPVSDLVARAVALGNLPRAGWDLRRAWYFQLGSTITRRFVSVRAW